MNLAKQKKLPDLKIQIKNIQKELQIPEEINLNTLLAQWLAGMLRLHVNFNCVEF